MFSQDRLILFIHIAKTGGTSFSDALSKLYRPEKRFIGNDLTIDTVNRLSSRLDDGGLIAGHVAPGVVKRLRDRAEMITILRRPDEHAISNYLHIRDDPTNPLYEAATNLSISEFLRQNPYHIVFQTGSLLVALSELRDVKVEDVKRNMSAVLRFMDSLPVVGVIDRAQETCRVISRHFNMEGLIQLPRLNTSTDRGVPPAVRERLRSEYHELRRDAALAPLFAIEELIYAEACAHLTDDIRKITGANASEQEANPTSTARFSGQASGLGEINYVCRLAHLNGHVIAGPYNLRPGEYEVEFHLNADNVAVGDDGSIKIEALAEGLNCLASCDLRGGGPFANAARTLRFACDSAIKTIEFKICASGYFSGELSFAGISLRRIAPRIGSARWARPGRTPSPSIADEFGQIEAPQFWSSVGNLVDSQFVCPLDHVDGHIIAGPYCRLEAGDYEVEFHFDISIPPAPEVGSVQIEVVSNQDRFLSSRVLKGAGPFGRRRRTLIFIHEAEAEDLEFRIGGSGYTGGALTFGGVSLRAIPRSLSAAAPGRMSLALRRWLWRRWRDLTLRLAATFEERRLTARPTSAPPLPLRPAPTRLRANTGCSRAGSSWRRFPGRRGP